MGIGDWGPTGPPNHFEIGFIRPIPNFYNFYNKKLIN